MSLNDMVSAERLHISFFGMRNAGKSSSVKKAMELLPLGPVVIIDTPGLDDEGELGRLRVQKAMQVLSSTDIAVLVVDAAIGLRELDRSLVACFRERKIFQREM